MEKQEPETETQRMGDQDDISATGKNEERVQSDWSPVESVVETLPQVEPFKHIHVIINPAAGREEPVLSTLNKIFSVAEVDWDVFITKKAGDARKYAQQAVQEGVDAVGVYGGDGTV